jgi:hypothetical protein
MGYRGLLFSGFMSVVFLLHSVDSLQRVLPLTRQELWGSPIEVSCSSDARARSPRQGPPTGLATAADRVAAPLPRAA